MGLFSDFSLRDIIIEIMCGMRGALVILEIEL